MNMFIHIKIVIAINAENIVEYITRTYFIFHYLVRFVVLILWKMLKKLNM